VERVTLNRRLASNLLEILLLVLTVIVGWHIWLTFTARNSQSPAKKLLDVYVIYLPTEQAASGWRTWSREVLKQAFAGWLLPAISIVTICLSFKTTRQASLDRGLKTVVVYAPHGLPPSMLPASSADPSRMVLGITSAPSRMIAESTSATDGEFPQLAARLRELAELRDEGILTPEEYERKRSELARKL
jgi:hypothetical protein